MWTILSIVWVIGIAEGYQDAFGKWIQCPQGYSAINGMCYSTSLCQEGYRLHTDGMCYLINPLPCPYDTKPMTTTPLPYHVYVPVEVPMTTTTPRPYNVYVPIQLPISRTTTSSTTSTTTTPAPEEEPIISYDPTPLVEPDEQMRCPSGSIYFKDQCRKILCSQGEYYAGRCLSPACPRGTVWRSKKCQEAGYITTILEIDNVIKNKHEYQTATENIQKVEYKTVPPYDPSTDESHIYVRPSSKIVVETKTAASLTPPSSADCCTVNSPRICRQYTHKWICFNHKKKLCDPRICTSPLIYLKPPEIVELDDPQMLVMPPHPPLSSCLTADCNESEMIDCSGCAHGLRESCSSSCYYYFCPDNSCEFKKSEDFCSLYPGEFGCNKNYGCIWSWCE